MNEIDLFALLDESDYYIDDDSGEFIITAPNIQFDGAITVEIPCKISSNCNAVIKCYNFFVKSNILYLNSINFEAPILVKDTQELSISNCTLKNNNFEYAAVCMIINCDNVHIDHVMIDNSQVGLFFANSIVTAENLTIHHCDSFIMCNPGTFLSLRDSNFHHSEKSGIYINGQANIEIDNCHFSDSKSSCIQGKNLTCSIKNSTFQNCEYIAIELYMSNDFTIENNHFTNFNHTSICILDNSCGTISNNTISKISGNGINCCDGCDIFISNNRFSESAYPAICIGSKSAATIQSNKITNSSLNGIVIRHAHHAEIEKNELNGIGLNAISLSDTNSSFIHGNEITNCKIAAVDVFNNTNVKVENNIISNVEFAFVASYNSSICAKNNQIENVKEAMAHLFLKGGGEFVDNKILNCSKQNICETTSFYLFSKNGDFHSVTNDASKKEEFFALDDLLHEESQLCLKCKKNKRDCYLSSCGHKIYCFECAEKLVPNKDKCPVCCLLVDKIMKGIGGNPNGICGICYENKADCMIVPCGHIGFCSSCLELWFKNKAICPMCRKDQSSFLKIIDI